MSIAADHDRVGLTWQTGVWDQIAQIYLREIDRLAAPLIAHVIARAALHAGQQVLDLGTGTGAAAIQAAPLVAPGGQVLGVDISPAMLTLAQQRVAELGLTNVTLREGRAEALPAPDGAFDVLLASLSLMYVLDRVAAAREIARVLRPGGRFVAAVWAGTEECDVVLLQQTAARFAPPPPVPGVGPGVLADATPFLAQLAAVGIQARVERETVVYDFEHFAAAWDVLAGVTAAQLTPERQEEAKAAVLAAMWPHGDGPRRFHNVTQFIIGQQQP
jgi:SAM-dependent methyltransferase